MSKLKVIDGGLFSTIQDSGREGYRKFGVPISGAMDMQSFKNANKLVGNKEDDPVIEFTLKGGVYKFNSDAVIAITGALMNPNLNDNKVEMNSSIQVRKGDILKIGFAEKGCRAYLAIQGEWELDEEMGSYSTYEFGKFGGLDGSKLKAGDEISWKNTDTDFFKRTLPKDEIPYYSSKLTVEFITGPEWEWLTVENQEEFLNTSFKVSSKSNRMGIRLETEEPILTQKAGMRSSGVIPGVIQLPPNGSPIILMKDGQTVGGYPRIGTIPEIYLDRIAQLPPNGTVRFIQRKEL
ncbi:MAG: biotin-dependent carboxyltransferase family protein [Balneola sp.]